MWSEVARKRREGGRGGRVEGGREIGRGGGRGVKEEAREGGME